MIIDVSELGTFLTRQNGAQGLLDLKTSFGWMEDGDYLPSQIIGRIIEEGGKIAKATKGMKAKLGTVNLKPTLEGIMGYDGDHVITIKPEQVTLHMSLKIQVDAEQLAASIAKGNKDKQGYFMTTAKVDRKELGLDP